MTPWVYEFRWETGHILFLLLFLSVGVTVAWTVVTALYRSSRDRARGMSNSIIWKSVFNDLTAEAKLCRHAMTGELKGRICPNAFTCSECAVHARLITRSVSDRGLSEPILGLDIPGDRLYHRGHTWVRLEGNGVVTIGLDDFGKRLAGRADNVELPGVGERVEVNGPCATLRRGHAVAALRSPVEGTVVEAASTGTDWMLKVKLATDRSLASLLTPREAGFWMIKELERLQECLAGRQTGLTLADGGALVRDVPAALKGEYAGIWEEMFLQP